MLTALSLLLTRLPLKISLRRAGTHDRQRRNSDLLLRLHQTKQFFDLNLNMKLTYPNPQCTVQIRGWTSNKPSSRGQNWMLDPWDIFTSNETMPKNRGMETYWRKTKAYRIRCRLWALLPLHFIWFCLMLFHASCVRNEDEETRVNQVNAKSWKPSSSYHRLLFHLLRFNFYGPWLLRWWWELRETNVECKGSGFGKKMRDCSSSVLGDFRWGLKVVEDGDLIFGYDFSEPDEWWWGRYI